MELPQHVFFVRSLPPPPQIHFGAISDALPCLFLIAVVASQGFLVLNLELLESILRGYGIPNLLLVFCLEALGFALGFLIDVSLDEYLLIPRRAACVLFVWIPLFGFIVAVTVMVVPATRRRLKLLCSGLLAMMLGVRFFMAMHLVQVLLEQSSCVRLFRMSWFITDSLRNLYTYLEISRNDPDWN